jgi:biopolymer transport protein ExbD
MSFSTLNSSQNSEINVTPLIDVLLVLLIIFMVIVPIVPHGLRSEVPQPPKSSVPTEPSPSTVVLEVQPAGSERVAYFINQHPVEAAALQARLTEIFALRQQKTVFVKGSRDLAYSDIAAVIGVAHAAAVTEIAVLTPAMEAGR